MATSTEHEIVATCTRGVEALLANELTACGARPGEVLRGAVPATGSLEAAYRACLWSRTASRILIVLHRFYARHAEAYYSAIRNFPWEEHLSARQSLAVDVVGQSPWVTNSHFAELRAKDAVVDRLRDRSGARPSVNLQSPDIRLHIHLAGERVTVSLDLAGDPLHRRGLGREVGDAPLKENLAAAALMLAGWPEAAASGAPMLDPMCGSGTFLIEAAWMARDVAPGMRRSRWGFSAWHGHVPPLWNRLLAEAKDRSRSSSSKPVKIAGFDTSNPMLATAESNARAAGVQDAIVLRRAPLGQAAPPEGWGPGLLITNPPYGHRLGEESELGPLYGELGDVLRRRFLGWSCWVLTGSAPLSKRIGLRPAARIPLWNGPLECRLLSYPIQDHAPTTAEPGWRRG